MRILLAYDGSSDGEKARDLIGNLNLPDDTQVSIVSVLPPPSTLFHADTLQPAHAADADRRLAEDAEAELDVAARFLSAAGRTVDVKVLRGRPGDTIVDEATRRDVDLVVMGSRGHGPFKSALLGSVSTEVVNASARPVLIARGISVHRVLVATDGSEDAMLAARAAISLVHDTGAELHVVHVGPKHVYPPPTAGPTPPTGTDRELRQEAQGVLDWQVDEITKAGGEITQAHLRMGRPAEEIMHLSEELVVGLIVVGNQGLGGRFSRMRHILMGSVSEKVSRYARCSVMVIRKDLYDRPSA